MVLAWKYEKKTAALIFKSMYERAINNNNDNAKLVDFHVLGLRQE